MVLENLISVIIPAYNVEAYISNCLDSVLQQSYENFELIVVDDGSSDNTGFICDEYVSKDVRIKVIHQSNAGVVAARQAGLDIASGDFVVFVDADDTVSSDMFAFMLSCSDSVDLVSVGINMEAQKGYVFSKTDNYSEGIHSEDFSFILNSMLYDIDANFPNPLTPSMCNKLFRLDKAKKVYSRIPFNLTYGEDMLFVCLYMLESGAIYISKKCLYNYRFRADSAVHTVDYGFIDKIMATYKAFLVCFKDSEDKYNLLIQLQKWYILNTVLTINNRFDFSECCHIVRFIADLDGLKDKRIVLYGAGEVGDNYFRQLRHFGYDVVLWADRNYLNIKRSDFSVSSPDSIVNADYDVVLIAIENESIAEKIRCSLLAMGIAEDKIIWRRPYVIF